MANRIFARFNEVTTLQIALFFSYTFSLFFFFVYLIWKNALDLSRQTSFREFGRFLSSLLLFSFFFSHTPQENDRPSLYYIFCGALFFFFFISFPFSTFSYKYNQTRLEKHHPQRCWVSFWSLVAQIYH